MYVYMHACACVCFKKNDFILVPRELSSQPKFHRGIYKIVFWFTRSLFPLQPALGYYDTSVRICGVCVCVHREKGFVVDFKVLF